MNRRICLKIIYISIFCIALNNSLLAQSTLLTFLKEGQTIVVEKVIDLEGNSVNLSPNTTLKFIKGGCIKNGTLIGENTSITGYAQNIFDNVQILGEWNVRYISTAMFKDNSMLNTLKSVFSLTSDKINNILIVEDGDYKVGAGVNGETILEVPSNTEVIINGIIRMSPNKLSSYSIIGLYGENILLHGRGEIIGDKHTHIGTDGEWGMGVRLAKCTNVCIYDLSIKDCWGDCIYIGTQSTDVRINNCILDHGRRQGISITSANNVLIENCMILNVGGTAPEYAIDIEPNDNETVDSVVVRNVKSRNCKGGFLVYGRAPKSAVNRVELYNCYVEEFSKADYAFNKCNDIKIINCISDKGTKPLIKDCMRYVNQ